MDDEKDNVNSPLELNASGLAETNKKSHQILENTIEKVQKDNSPEAKSLRHKRLLKAVFGEFACSYIFYTSVYGGIVFTTVNNYPAAFAKMANGFIASFSSIALPLAFSELSGAQINPLIPISLYLTGKQRIRRTILYIFVQFVAAILAVITMLLIFHEKSHDIFDMIDVEPVPGNVYMGQIFMGEAILSFFLIYISFAVAFIPAEHVKYDQMSFKGISETEGLTVYTSSPQSELGFAPFSIGLTVFSLVLMGGDSNAAFNPVRMFAPACFNGNFNYLFLYLLGQIVGCILAALLIVNEQKIIEFLFNLNILGTFLGYPSSSSSTRRTLSIVDYSESSNVSIKDLFEAEFKSQMHQIKSNQSEFRPISPTMCE